MASLKAQLRQLIDVSHDGSVNAAARDIGVPQATLARMVDGRVTNPKAESLRPVAAYYGTTIDWLLTGEGTGPSSVAGGAGEVRRRWVELVGSLGLNAEADGALRVLPTAVQNAARNMPLKRTPEEMAKVGLDHVVREQATLLRAQQLEVEAWLVTLSAWIDSWGIEVVRNTLQRPDVLALLRGGFVEPKVLPQRFDPDPYGIEAHRKGVKVAKAKAAKRRRRGE